MVSHRLTIRFLGVLLSLGAAPSVGSELIVNGSFEQPLVPAHLIDQVHFAPSTDITGWTLTGGSIDLARNSAFWTAHTGTQLIDITGSNPGTLAQTFPTTADQKYLLTLYYANNPNPSFPAPQYDAQVTVFGGAATLYTEFITHVGSTPEDMQWTLLSHVFVANGPSATLQLKSLTPGFNGVVFDTVSVVQVPEPSTLILSGMVLAGLAAFGWSHR